MVYCKKEKVNLEKNMENKLIKQIESLNKLANKLTINENIINSYTNTVFFDSLNETQDAMLKIQKIISDSNKIYYLNEDINKIFINNSEIFNKTLSIFKEESIYSKIECNILKTYSNTFDKYVNKVIKNSNYIQSVNILQETINNRLEILDTVKKVYNDEITVDFSIDIPNDNDIMKYLGYTFRKDSEVSLEEEYKRLELDDIQELGKRIIKKITKINEIHKLNTNEYFFNYTDETLFFAQYIISPTKTEEEYKELISQVFIVIYENSGVGANKIYEYLPDCESLTFIKHYRAYYEHKYKKKDKNQYIEINNFIISTLDKSLPSNWHDWVKLQKALYKKIDSMLSNILVELEKKFKEKNKNIATD